MSRIARVSTFVALAACCLWMASCSGNPQVRLKTTNATLEGAVTYKGKPVPYALVIASAGDSPAATGNADASGKYSLQNVPLGTVQIGVNSEAGKGMMMGQIQASGQGEKKAPLPKFVDVPEKYADPASSGVTTTVSEGANTFDIELK